MHGYGEAPVTVWYQSHVTFARLRIPYPYNIRADVYKRAPRHNYIDDYILKHLQVLHIPPSPPAGDAEFIRRVYLDAAGILPAPAEVERFLNDAAPEKPKRLIEQLMRRPEFVNYWAYKWSDLLLVSSNHLSDEGVWSYYNWIRESVAADLISRSNASQVKLCVRLVWPFEPIQTRLVTFPLPSKALVTVSAPPMVLKVLVA